jgi:cytochrome c biogenesis protein CcmG/thiol:disulfide interchange protein DsbE
MNRPSHRKTPLLLALFLLIWAGACAPPPQNPDIQIGEPIPDFELPALGGGEVASASLADGRPVVLNFWATWCGPCRREIPTLRELQRSGEARVVSISVGEEPGVVAPFVERHGIDYPVLLADHAFFRSFNGDAIPYTLVLDPSLRIVRMHRGYVSRRQLERDLRRAAEAGVG